MVAEQDRSGSARRLILHCGVQKTGTTSLHHFLQRNRAALAGRLDILTPRKGSALRDLGQAAQRFCLDPTPDTEATLSGIVQTLRDRCLSGTGPLLLSHENLLGAMLGNSGRVTLYPRMEQIIALLDRDLAPLTPDYVIYTRDMASWKNSVYGQAVKSDRYTGTRGQFLEDTAGCGTWDDLRTRLEAAVGPDRARVFRLEDEPDPSRPGSQLLRHAGLSAADLSSLTALPARANRGLGPGALEFLRQVNGLDLGRNARAQIVGVVTANPELFMAEVPA